MSGSLTLTAANSVISLVVAGLYPTPQTLQGYATDRAFETEAAETAETAMGVDARFSAGYVPTETRMSIDLQADSPSMQIFEDWDLAQRTIKEVYFCSMNITIPAVRRQYACIRGVLRSAIRTPAAHKILQARAWGLTFGSVTAVPYLGP